MLRGLAVALPLALCSGIVYANDASQAAQPYVVSVKSAFDTKDGFEASHQRALASNPPGLHLKISLEAGQTTFHIGDTIRLQYELTADEPGKYVGGSRVFDQTPRSILESFIVDRPADAFDPLRGFWSLQTALLCQHFDSNRTPTLKLGPNSPQQDAFEITHYLRFYRAGRYRLYAVTRSILAAGAGPREHTGTPLASENFVTFEILSQDVAAASKEVEAILAQVQRTTNPRFMPPDAFRLFEIGTPEARRAAAQLLTFRHNSPDSDSTALATLIAAPTRQSAVMLLSLRLHDTALVIDEQLLVNLSLLRFAARFPSITPGVVFSATPEQLDRWRSLLAEYRLSDFRAALATLDGRAPDVRASSARALDHLAGWTFCEKPVSEKLSTLEYQKLHQLHLTSLPDLPSKELTYELLNFGWAKDFSRDQVLPVLVQIYDSPPKESPGFIRETDLHVIEKYDANEAGALFRDRVLNSNTPLDWNRIRSLNLPTGPGLDQDFVAILENRWTERMSRVAPLIGLYATDGILERVKNVYEVEGPGWPCSIESGLLTYFLRVDPEYGKQKLGPALETYSVKGGSGCHTNLLVDIALLRNAPELKPFVESALNDPRPLIAAAGAQVTAFGDIGKMPCDKLLARLRVLHDDWQGIDISGADYDSQRKWNSGYNELERIISIDLVNAGDSPEHAAAWKQALDLCVTDRCRKMMLDRLARSRY